MHVGLTPWDFTDRSAKSLARQAQIGESLGYESFWLPESHFTKNALPDPLMLLAATAATTDRIKLGTTSFLLPVRNPLLAAEQVAVLDQLSSGRVLLGVGRGYASAMLRAFDVAPKDKRLRFEANLGLMMRAWSGAPIAVEGAPEPIVLDPLPAQRPHPPVWVAAFGPKALAQAGRLGLPYLASPMETLAGLRSKYELHQQAAVAAGHGEITTRPIMRTLFIGRSRREIEGVRERLRQAARPRGDDEDLDDWALVGDRGQVAEKFAEYREALNATHWVVTRLRISGIDQGRLLQSVADALEVLGG